MFGVLISVVIGVVVGVAVVVGVMAVVMGFVVVVVGKTIFGDLPGDMGCSFTFFDTIDGVYALRKYNVRCSGVP